MSNQCTKIKAWSILSCSIKSPKFFFVSWQKFRKYLNICTTFVVPIFQTVSFRYFLVFLIILFRNRLWHRCFPVNFAKFLITPFYRSLGDCLCLFYEEQIKQFVLNAPFLYPLKTSGGRVEKGCIWKKWVNTIIFSLPENFSSLYTIFLLLMRNVCKEICISNHNFKREIWDKFSEFTFLKFWYQNFKK